MTNGTFYLTTSSLGKEWLEKVSPRLATASMGFDTLSSNKSLPIRLQIPTKACIETALVTIGSSCANAVNIGTNYQRLQK